ncbi:MAG TPA: Asp23/Gls24 family envelope stress response protein [Streptosporangiaceae bacterium]|nr:Asp23/Gls24 family envelope stress response protein [Streptosporangiaceae bacterium]
MTTSEIPRQAAEDSPAGRNELGVISVSESAVADIAALAAAEIPDVGGAAPRVLGRAVTSGGAFGVRPTSLTAPPKARARVDGSTVRLDLSMSVRWPAPLPEVTTAVREHVRTRVSELTGLSVEEISISVTALVIGPRAAARVR